MDSRQLIDAQFDRSVQIVQSLPKTGPIQTGYEEKLAMYSLYKQATVGNVKTPRPAMWDMLGRAKWDAWAKHKDLESYEAKWLYVDALLRVLRKYSDKTVARDLVKELESYGGDVENIAMSGSSFSRSRSRGTDSSGSSASLSPAVPGAMHSSLHLQDQQQRQRNLRDPTTSEEETEDGEDDADDDKENVMPPAAVAPQAPGQSQHLRPQSALSTQRYRTPAGSFVMSPPPSHASTSMPMGAQHTQPQAYHYHHAQVPQTQPMPGFETPSAFRGPSPRASATPSYPTASTSTSAYPFAHAHPYPPNMHPGHPAYRAPLQPSSMTQEPLAPHDMRSTLERAVAGVQAHLAALQERIEALEANTGASGLLYHSRSSILQRGGGPGGAGPGARRPSPAHDAGSGLDWAHMGMWSVVLTPLARVARLLLRALAFVLHHDGDGAPLSPARAVLRRLLLDVSFVLCVIALARVGWRRSGVRRREVVWALHGLWRAVAGTGASGAAAARVLIDRGV